MVSFSGFQLRDRVSFFVKIGSMAGSIFAIFDSESCLKPFALCECDSNCLDGNISTFFDRFGTSFLAEHNFVHRNKRTGYCLRKFYSGTGYHLTLGQGSFIDFSIAHPCMFVGQVPPPLRSTLLIECFNLWSQCEECPKLKRQC